MKRKRLISSILLFTLAPMLLTGCWDRRELEDQAFILTIGIDKTEKAELLISFRIAIPSKSGLGQSGGGGGGGEGSIAEQSSLLTTISAPSLPAAMLLASGYINRELSLLHTKAIVFGEDAAKEGIAPILGILTRYRELRRNVFLCVSKGTAYDFLKVNAPDLEKSYAKYWEGVKLMESAEAIHPGSILQQFVSDSSRLDRNANMIYLAVNKDSSEGSAADLKSPSSFKEGHLAVKAGEIPRKGGNKAEYLGTAIFKGGKLVKVLNLSETVSLMMAKGNFKKTFYTIPDPEVKNKVMSFEIKQGSPPSIKISTKGDQISIKEKLFLEGDLIGIQGQVDYAATAQGMTKLDKITAKILEQRIRDIIKKEQKLSIDIVGYGGYAKKNFLSQGEWEKFRWHEKFKDADITLEVNYATRRTGMLGKQPGPLLE